MNSQRKAEIHVMAAAGGVVIKGENGEFTTRPPTLAEVRERADWMTDREFSATLRRLVLTGAVVRTGRGNTATVTHDFAAWHGRNLR